MSKLNQRSRRLKGFGGLAGAAFVALTAVGALTMSASATPPGANGRIAFTRYESSSGGEGVHGAVFTIGLDGKGEQQLTHPPLGVSDVQPDWSPDGARIVFERQFPDKPYEIWSIKPDGSDLEQIKLACPVPEDQICDVSSPAWSPNGGQIALNQAYGHLKYVNGVEWIEVGALSVADADGSNVHQLTQLKRPTSSEDGQPRVVSRRQADRVPARELDGVSSEQKGDLRDQRRRQRVAALDSVEDQRRRPP